MNYNKMPDFEINKRVAYLLGYTDQGEGWIDNNDGIYNYICKPKEGYRYSLPDYCNCWADAGPIIEKESICLEKETGLCCDYCMELYEKITWQATHCTENAGHTHENPLRAAMIVFLILKEAK